MPILSDNEIRALLDRITALEADVGKLRAEVQGLREMGRAGHSASQHGADDSAKNPPPRPSMARTVHGGYTGFGNGETDMNAVAEMLMADPSVVSFTYEIVPVKK